jgi:nucleotidyltransferase substrate binding protein (TIGR01987 family)
MVDADARWRQRYDNFDRAYRQLATAAQLESFSLLERAGLIQTFEFTYELAWKTMKDFLEAEGFDVSSPRDTIEQAFQSGYLVDGKGWLRMLENRNRLAHTYDEALSLEAQRTIVSEYVPLLQHVHGFFTDRVRECSSD